MFCSKQVMIGTSKSIWGFDPRIVPGCALWLDGADQRAMTFSGSSVTQWNDKSGNGYNFVTQGSFAAPVISNNAVGSLSAVSFTGNNIQNNSANQILTNVSFPLNSSAAGYSIFAVSRQNASHPTYTGYNYIVSAYGGTAGNGLFYGTTFSNFFLTANGTAGPLSGFNDLTDNVPNTLMTSTIQTSIEVNGSVLTPYLNGVAMTTKVGTCVALTGISVGNAYAPGGGNFTGQTWGGIICEVLIYNSVLTTTQRQQIEGYLGWKWEISRYYNPNFPKTISGCQLWLDGTDPAGTGVTPSNGSTISTWVDKSGNANSPTSSSGTYPTYTSTSRAVTWTGGAAQLTFPTSLHSAVVGTAFTIFFVEQRTTGSENFIIRGTNLANNSNLLIGHGGLSASTSWRFAFYGNDLDFTGLPSYSSGESATVSCFMYSDPNRAIYHNGSIAANASDTNSTDLASWTGAMIGGNYNWNAYFGNVFEMLIYNTALTTAQRQSVEDYLSTKWKLTITSNSQLPIAHPFYSIKPHLRAFQPLDIEDCIVWLDAADRSTITPSNGGLLSTWTDKSGQGNSIVNISATAPTYSNADSSVNFSALSSTWVRGNLSTTYSNAATSFAVFSTSIPTASVSGGQVTTFAGSVGNTGIFYFPYGIATDNAGNVFVSDTYNNRIRKVTSGGSVSDFAYGFYLPLGIGYDSSTGGIWVADSQYNRVVRLNSGGGATNYYYGFNIPSGVAVDSNGNGYVADSFNNRIQRVSTGGSITTFAGSGTAGYLDGTGTGAQFNQPRALGFDPSQSNLYVCDSQNHRIRKIVMSTVGVTTIAGSGVAGDANGIGTAAQFNYPYGVCSDGSSNLYIAGFVDQRVRKIDLTTNTVTTFAGDSNGYADGFGTAALFKYPSAIGINSSSNIFVADNNNQLVRKIVISNGTSDAVLTNPRIATLGLSNASTENSLTGQTIVTTSNLLNVGSFVATSTNPTGEGSNLQTVLGHGSYNTKLLVASASTYTTPFFSIRSTLNGNNQTNGSGIGTYTADSSYGATYNRYALGSLLNATATSNVSLNGKIFEYLLYARVLTDSQRQQVESYLAWKWGLNSSLSVFTPNNMFGCTIWFDAADSSTVTLNGSNVSSWRDKSGNGYSVGQTTSAYQPTYTSNLLNGLPGIQLSSARYLYQIGSSVPNFSSTPETTVFIVAKNGSSYTASGWNIVSTMWFTGSSGATSRYHFSFGLGGTNGVTLYANNAASGTTSSLQTTAVALNTNAIIGFTLSAAGSSINVNGTLSTFTTMSATSANNSTWLLFGDARNAFVTDVNIYEFIGFNRDLSTTERQQIQGYLSQKWGVGSLSPAPSKYPFSSFPSASVVPFLPTDILGCTIWLDANDPIGTGIQPANSSSISTWVDKSGNSKNMSVYAGSPVFNTTPSRITFNGSTSLINTTFTSQIFTLFIVYLQTTAAGPVYTTSTTQEYSGFWPNEGGTTYFTRVDNNSWYTQTSTFPINTRRILVIQYTAAGTGANMYVWSDGILSISTTSLGARTVTSLLLGHRPTGNNFLTGNYNEVIQYDSVLTTAQRQAVEGYLSQKWQLSLGYYIPSPLVISGCRLWLDATDSSGFTGSSPVTAWLDKSTFGNSTTSSLGSPSISPSAINGRPAMYFNGSSSFFGSLSAASSTTITVFIIGSLISPFATFSGLLSFGNPSQLDYDNIGSLPITMYIDQFKIYGARNSSSQPTPITANVPFMYVLQYDGTYINTYLNGTQQTDPSINIASSGTFTYTNYSVANRAGTTGSIPWSGYFGEIVVYQSALTTIQRQQMEGYLALKWGLRTSLPTTHPYYSQRHPYNTIPPPARSPDAAAPSFSAVGGAIVSANGFIYHVFVASSSFVATGSRTVNYLLVGGGGGGGDRHGGGGGAGGVLTGTFSATSGTYTVTVGAGGAGGNYETNNSTPRGSGIKGGDTTVTGLSTANGGGGGGTVDGNPTGTVGSGGGGGGTNLAGVAGTAGQGNAGGSGLNPGGGGGGGAGGNGVNANVGTGGIGTTAHSATLLAVGYGTTFALARPPNIVISGGLAYIAGGGGGAAASGGANGGFGGLGGGGRGDWDNDFISAGTPNTGGGGGASRSESGGGSAGFAGGSGLVVLWY
jgi:sugar lactone lactonase YvrE